MPSLEVCPNHGGSFDCSPFCVLCEGKQGFDPDEMIGCQVRDCQERLDKGTYAEEGGFCVEHQHAYFNHELDPFTLERLSSAD